MGTTHHSIQIDANIKTHLSGMNDVVKQLQAGLENGVAKIDMTRGLGKDLSKLFSKFETSYSKFGSMISPDNMLKIGDAKEFQRTGDQIISTFNQIQRIATSFGTKEIIDAKKLFPSAFDSNVSNMIGALEKLGGVYEQISAKEGKITKLTNEIAQLEQNIQGLQALSSEDSLKGFQASLDATKEKAEKANAAVEELKNTLKNKAAEQTKDFGTDEASKKVLEDYEKNLKKIQELQAKGYSAKGGRGMYKGKGYNSYKGVDPEVAQNIKEYTAALNELKRISSDFPTIKIQEILAQDPNLDNTKSIKALGDLLGLSQDVTNALVAQKEAANEAAKAQKDLSNAEGAAKKIDNSQTDIEAKRQAVADLRAELEKLKQGMDLGSVFKALNEIPGLENISIETLKSAKGVEQLKTSLEKIDENAFNQLKAKLQEMGFSLGETKPKVDSYEEALRGAGNAAEEFMSKTSQLEQLKSRLAYFFGITNSINLFKRAIRGAMDTVKELDAVMTETAVVTEFDIGDMWDKLPQYAAQANQLGASIKDMYAATTLYYQQGLDSEAAMGVGVETMKMARIAGMEAADATTAMTAALRGFNMEVNEMNAQRVNDVYSELAAITAADTNQIATAMSKTASIAASANMEFETTSALLAQIIETTQEAPETAGTAMKTIIARFTEVKELFSEGMLTGEDEEGEEININKIDAALKSVGISLRDFLTGSKGIDDIFLELASKWDTLDLATQRYIATMAAGSRQQSRFIAMMSNYERTMELVDAANNSAGASQDQFDKTLESMEAKLQKLSNAWNQFLMGLANNDILKGGISALTGLIEVINKVTDGISGGNGIIKSIINLGVAFAGLKAGKAVLGGIMASLSNAMNGKAMALSTSLKAAFGNEFQKIMPKLTMPMIKFDTAGAKAYQASLTSLQASLASVTAAEEASAIAKSTGLQIDTTKAALTNAIAAADRDLAAATTQLAAATGLENVQAQEAVLLGAQGVSQDLAVLAVKNGITAASLSGAAATQAEAEAEIRLALAKKGVIVAQHQGIMGRLEEIVLTNLHTAAVNGSTLAHKLEEAALKSKTAAMLVSLGVIGLIIVAAIALVAAIVAIGKALYNSTPAQQLKAAKEATEDAEEAAKKATESYQELTDTIAELDDKLEAIENLTRGTDEWRKAVTELNQEMLNLIDLNPEIAPFVKNVDGILKIDKTGQQTNSLGQTYEQVMEQIYLNTQQLGIIAKQRKLEELELQSYNDLLNYKKGVVESAQPGRYFQQGYDSEAIMLIQGDEGENSEVVSSNEEREIAKAIADGTIQGLEYDDSQESQEINTKILSNYIQEAFGHSAMAADILAESLANETAALSQFGHQLLIGEQQAKLYSDQMANQLIEQANISDIQGKTILEQIDSSFITDRYNTIYEDELASQEITQAEKRRYAEMMGYEWKWGRRYDTGEKVEVIKNSEVKKALAAADAAETYGIELKQLSSELGRKNTQQQDLILQLLSQDGAGMKNETLYKYGEYINGRYQLKGQEYEEDFLASLPQEFQSVINSIVDETERDKKLRQAKAADTMTKEMGFEGIADYAASFKMSVEEAVEQISSSFEAGGDAFLDARTNVVKKMKKYNASDKTPTQLAEHLAKLEGKIGEEFINMISNVYSNLELSGDEQLVTAGAAGFTELANLVNEGKLSVDELEKASDFIGEVNWSNSIEAVAALRREIEYGTGAAKSFAEAMMGANLNYLNIGQQTQDLFQSEQYTEIQGELENILATSEAIGASDVKNLASSYKILDNYLKNTEVTASGLAKALTEIQNGTLKVEQLTTAVMSALSSFNSLEDTIANVLDELENFDLGPDENQIAAKTKEWAELIRGNMKKGAYGNSQNDKILDYVFGANWDKVDGETLIGDAYVARMDYLTKFLENNQNNYLKAWSQFESGYNVEGKEIDYSSVNNNLGIDGAGPQLSRTAKGGVAIDNIGTMTTKELTKWISEAYGVTENLAEMMIGDLANYSTNIRPALEENDYQAGIQAAWENAARAEVRGFGGWTHYGQIRTSDLTKVALIDEQEIQAIHEATGRAYDEIKADFEAKGALITNFFDEEGAFKQGEELFKEINRVYGEDFAKQFNKTLDDWRYDPTEGTFNGRSENYYDLAGFEAGLDNFNFNQAQKDQVINEQLAQLTEGGKSVEIEIEADNGELVTVLAEAGDTIDELRKKANMSEEASAFGKALTQAIVDAYTAMSEESFDVTPKVNKEQTQGDTEDAIAAATATPNVIIDTEKITEAVSAAISAAVGTPTVNPPTGNSDTGSDGTTSTYQQDAKGVVNSPRSELSLTGEEGPELVQTGEGAYLVGQEGPEMAYINKGDTVYTAEQTKKIFEGSNPSMMPRFEPGQNNGGTVSSYTISGYDDVSSGSGGGSGSSEEEEEPFETSVDKLYNLLRDIEEEMRIQEQLERRYIKILDSLNTTAAALVDVSFAQLEQLEKQRGLAEERIAGRKQQIQSYMRENSQYNNYAWSETDEHGNMVLRINWDAINSITDKDQGSEVEEYLSKLEEMFDDMYEAEDSIYEIEDQIKEINERGKDEYFKFEDSIKEALINERQKEIDKLDEINQSINDTNSKLLDAMRDSIDQQRRERENERTEDDLAEKQRRLSYLQQDTSGASALDILALQDEIDQMSEDYTDTLIDQKISELQEQNDKAAEQREKQIEILQAQLDNWVESGEIWKEVYELMDTGISDEGVVIDGSRLMELLKADAEYASMSNLEKLTWGEELRDSVAQALHYLQVGRQLENLQMQGQTVTFVTADGKTVTGVVQEDGSVIDNATGKVYHKVYQTYDGSYKTDEKSTDVSKPTTNKPTDSGGNGGNGGGNKPNQGSSDKNNNPNNHVTSTPTITSRGKWQYDPTYGNYRWIYYSDGTRKMEIQPGTQPGNTPVTSSPNSSATYNPNNSKQEIARWTETSADGKYIETWVKYSDNTRKVIAKELIINKPQADASGTALGFATGGLADFTGPAWLDGTKSRPEYVLNSDQTKAFFTLVDILQGLNLGASKSTENSGDTNYDIDINVESIGSDYDVEQMAGTIKRLINEDARYRNNNAVNLMR